MQYKCIIASRPCVLLDFFFYFLLVCVRKQHTEIYTFRQYNKKKMSTTLSVSRLAKFQPMIRSLYKKSGTKWDIGTWSECIGKHMNIIDHDDVYEPITLHIKVAGRLGSAEGCVPIRVDPTDSDWHTTVRGAIAQGMAISEKDLPHVTFHNMRGDDISSMTPDQLHHVGEISVQVRGTPHKVDKVFVPAAHVRINKINDVSAWYTDTVREQIIDHVSSALVGSTIDTLDLKTRRDGDLIREIQGIVEESVPRADMNAFLKTYGVNERARNTPGVDAAARIARHIMGEIRRGINANEGRIANYHAEQAARRAAHEAAKRAAEQNKVGNGISLVDDDESSIDQPLFGARHMTKVDVAPVTVQDMENDQTMYSRIVRRALERPEHVSSVVYMIYRASPTGKAARSAATKVNTNVATGTNAVSTQSIQGHMHGCTKHAKAHHDTHHMDRYGGGDKDDTNNDEEEEQENGNGGDNDNEDNDADMDYDMYHGKRRGGGGKKKSWKNYGNGNDDDDYYYRYYYGAKVQAARKFQQFTGRHVFMKPGKVVTLASTPANASTPASTPAHATALARAAKKTVQTRVDAKTFDPLNAPVPASIPLVSSSKRTLAKKPAVATNRHEAINFLGEPIPPMPPSKPYVASSSVKSSIDTKDIDTDMPRFVPYAEGQATINASIPPMPPSKPYVAPDATRRGNIRENIRDTTRTPTFKPWANGMPPEKLLNEYADQIEAHIAESEDTLNTKLWSSTNPKDKSPVLSNGMPSLYAFLKE